MRTLCERAKEAEKDVAIIEDRLETIFSQYTSYNRLLATRSAAHGQFLEGSLQDFSRDLGKS